MTYLRKPTIVQAVQFNGVDPEQQVHWSALPDWIIGALEQQPGLHGKVTILSEQEVCALVYTESGTKTVQVGDWIVREPDGKFTVETQEDFASKYEVAEDACHPPLSE